MIKNDFIKLKIKSTANGVFAEEQEKIIPAGRGYLLKALDESLLKHKIGDEYILELSANEAYGPRIKDLIKMIPAKHFITNGVRPVVGLTVNIDGLMGKVISAGSGRTLVDFNHPFSGKDMKFEVKINEEIKDAKTKTEAILKLLLNQELKVEEKENDIFIKDDIKLPENIKEHIVKELKETIKELKNIKFIS